MRRLPYDMINSEVTEHYKKTRTTMETEIYFLKGLIMMRNNQPLSELNQRELLSLPLLKDNIHIKNYPHIRQYYEDPVPDSTRPFDIYIDSLIQNMINFQRQLDEDDYTIIPSIWMAPERNKYFKKIENDIGLMISLLNTLFKIKNNEPISQTEHDHLLSVNWFKQDKQLAHYNNIIQPENTNYAAITH